MECLQQWLTDFEPGRTESVRKMQEGRPNQKQFELCGECRAEIQSHLEWSSRGEFRASLVFAVRPRIRHSVGGHSSSKRSIGRPTSDVCSDCAMSRNRSQETAFEGCIAFQWHPASTYGVRRAMLATQTPQSRRNCAFRACIALFHERVC